MFAKACALFLCAAAAALAQPAVSANGMVNAASYIQAGLPNGDVAQGSIFMIWGGNMGPATPAFASWPLPTTQGLGGATAQVKDFEGVSHPLILIYVSAGQIDALLPSAVAVGPASLTVTYNGRTSQPETFNVVQSSVGLFTRNSAGSGPGIVQQYHNGVPTLNDISNSAIPGDTAVLWGTGLGPITTDETQQPVAPIPLAAGAQVWVGDQQVPPDNVAFQGRSTFAGVDQINFTIPNITGCYVPVLVKVGNIVSNTVSMSIGPSGGTCSDPLNSFTGLNIQTNGLKQASVSLSRSTTSESGFGDFIVDSASGEFVSYNGTQLASKEGQPVYGACTVSTFFGTQGSVVDPVTPTYLDAGTLLVGPLGGGRVIAWASKGVYSVVLGTNSVLFGPAPVGGLYLTPGDYTLTATGGADVGPFTSTLTLPESFQWTNRDAIASVSRANGVTVNWTGGSGYVTIIGISATAQSVGASFSCQAPASAGTFTVPPVVLLALPASATAIHIPGWIGTGGPLGILTVENQPVTVPLNPNPPQGLDVGSFSAVFSYTTFVGYN
jgi:uncharacterized protein (TIGR03437 family)